MVWFWYFLIYSFLGFLVEVVYVRVVGGATIFVLDVERFEKL